MDTLRARWANSWALAGECWAVLRKDKELLLFSVFSGIALAAIGLLLLGPALGLLLQGLLSSTSGLEAPPESDLLLNIEKYGLLFLWYFLSYGAGIFFQAALIGCALKRFEGEDPTLRDGLRLAWGHKGRIVAWALVAATVGVLLRLLEGVKLGKGSQPSIGRIVSALLGFAWSLVTYLVVPVLVVEGVGPIEALRRSARLLKKTWGEQLLSGVAFGGILFLLGMLGFLPIVVGALLGGWIGALLGLGVTMLYWLGLGVLTSALQGIYRAALYRYATTGEVPTGFAPERLAQAFRPRPGSERWETKWGGVS